MAPCADLSAAPSFSSEEASNRVAGRTESAPIISATTITNLRALGISLCLLNMTLGGSFSDLNRLRFKSAQAQTCRWCYARSWNPAGEVTFAMEPGIIGVIGLLFGSLIAWLVLRSRTATLTARLSLMEKELAAGKADLARLQQAHTELVAGKARLESALESERKTNDEKIALVTRASEDLRNAFKAMASEALKSNNSSFLVIAEETLKRFQSQAKGDLEARQKAVADMVAPVRDSLNKVDAQIQQMEVARGDAYGELRAQVQSLITTQKELQSETGNLVRALRTPNVRGRWGEIQLRRVVEIAGMLSYCDFAEQESVTTETGRLRPDLVVKLPGGKRLLWMRRRRCKPFSRPSKPATRKHGARAWPIMRGRFAIT